MKKLSAMLSSSLASTIFLMIPASALGYVFAYAAMASVHCGNDFIIASVSTGHIFIDKSSIKYIVEESDRDKTQPLVSGKAVMRTMVYFKNGESININGNIDEVKKELCLN